jgi:hypothetical protein
MQHLKYWKKYFKMENLSQWILVLKKLEKFCCLLKKLSINLN